MKLSEIEQELDDITQELNGDTFASFDVSGGRSSPETSRRERLEQDILSSSLSLMGSGQGDGLRALDLAMKRVDERALSPLLPTSRPTRRSSEPALAAMVPCLNERRSEVLFAVLQYFFWKLAQHGLSRFILTEGIALAVPAPIFVCWAQSVVCVAIAFTLGTLGARAHDDGLLARFPPLRYSPRLARLTARVSLAYVAMVALDTIAHRSTPSAVRHAVFALAPLGAVAVGYVAIVGDGKRQETLPTEAKPRAFAAVALALMLVGSLSQVSVGQMEALRWTTGGFVAAWTAAAVWTAFMVQKVASSDDPNDPGVLLAKWRIVGANAVNSALLFAPLVLLSGESSVLLAHSEVFASPAYWVLMLFAGATRYCLLGALVEQVILMSPLGHLVSNVACAAFVVVLDAMLSQSIAFETLLSALVVLSGGALYAWARRDD